jgi:DNA-binding NarL/FixJ family response regulator
MPRNSRILVADNPGILRDGLCALLAGASDLEVVGTAANSAETLRAVDDTGPDVLIVDLSCLATKGAELIAELKKRRPQLRILVLTFHKEDYLIEAALRAGADGYLLKNDERAELFGALNALGEGRRYLSTAISEHVTNARVSAPGAGHGRQPPARTLTPREIEVIKLIAEGHRTREIARQLSLSHKTIEKHRTSLMRKLGLKTATAVAVFAISHGYHNG